MTGMRFVPLGVGDAFTALHYSTCLAVEAEGGWLLVDCPHPIRKMMLEAGARSAKDVCAERVLGVALTHLHADHASGLEGLAYYFRFVLGKRLPLLVHPRVAARLWEGHLAAGMEQLLPAVGAEPVAMGLEDYLDVTYLDETKPVTFGPFQAECRATIHHVPTYALRLAAGGRTLGHSADTAFDPSLVDWLAEADVMVHETNFGVHTPYERLAALPAELRARMRLMHYPDGFDVDGSVIEPLREGAVYEVERR